MVSYNLSPSMLSRYFFFECPRYLRYHATPKAVRMIQQIPAGKVCTAPAAKALLDAGFSWEEQVVRNLSGQVQVASGSGPLHERVLEWQETLAGLSSLSPGQHLYQPTLQPPVDFLSQYGVGSDLCRFGISRPDLIRCSMVHGEPKLQIIDVKASEMLKGSHRIQVTLYARMLQEVLRANDLPLAADQVQAGIWLYNKPEPVWFDLLPSQRILEDFFSHKLREILTVSPEDLGWHLYYRCEWCEFYEHCREEAEEKRSVSLLPFLSVAGRAYLREARWEKSGSVDTLDDLTACLERDDAPAICNGCGSLRNRRERYIHALQALDQQKIVRHSGYSVGFPKHESVRIVLTLQENPVDGTIYAAGVRRFSGNDGPFGDLFNRTVFVAKNAEECATVCARFVDHLHGLLEIVDGYNRDHPEWNEQLSLQTYVFDTYEQHLFNKLLYEAVKDPDLAQKALALLFHFQDTTLSEADLHPGQEVPFPLIVLTGVIRRLAALPISIFYRLPEVLKVLPDPYFTQELPVSKRYWFDLSNTLRSDAILSVWNGQNVEAGVEAIQGELARRLDATSAVVSGIRSALGESLVAWAPKFHLPSPMDFSHPLLSRLAFIVRYESFIAALEVREKRSLPASERLEQGIGVPVISLGDDLWELEAPLDPYLFEAQGGLRLIVPPGDEGERAQLCYDDYERRRKRYTQKNSIVRQASVEGAVPDLKTGLIKRVSLKVEHKKELDPFQKGDHAVLFPVFMDYNVDTIISRLSECDLDGTDLIRLIEEPLAVATTITEDPGFVGAARGYAAAHHLTSSQKAAFDQILTNRLTLVWGPPGTGKTTFLSAAILSLVQARQDRRQGIRILVTAFTHSAVENLLSKVQSQVHDLPVGKGVRVVKIDRDETYRRNGPASTTNDAIKAGLFADDPSLVLGGTVYGIYKASGHLAPFDLLIVDEASQLRFGELSLALAALRPGGRLVFAGDDQQLPPIIKGEYPEPEDGLPGLHESIFRYLRLRDDHDRPRYTAELLENWRMNSTLSRFPAAALYGDGYRPATQALAEQRLALKPTGRPGSALDAMLAWILDPAYPLVLAVLEDVQATVENQVEAGIVAALVVQLRERLLDPESDQVYPLTMDGDRQFFDEGLFIVSPHHAQIEAIRKALNGLWIWHSPPFVDTVDKMQGREADAVIVSYGVSDPETAQREATFIYSLNRLNVSVTRAKKKCITFLPRPLLTPSYELLQHEEGLKGLGHMLSLQAFCRENGEMRTFSFGSEETGEVRLTVLRTRAD
ncbi:AAA domain-containing protein [Methanosphaerula subterraneus]|uniref:DEAD/DEAH box helicase n=1 Tax=Methanosphaerula subterraneus TaxID=3350244 RepID=UPI003F85C703